MSGSPRPDDRWGFLARYPFDSPWVRSWVERWFLKLWFAAFAAVTVGYLARSPGSFGFDVRLYQLAARAWLDGRDPWAPSLLFGPELGHVSFAGPPPTLVPFLLVAWIPADILVVGFALTSGASAVWLLRRLGRPLWWMAFPPIVEGLWVGNLNIVVVALLLAGVRHARGETGRRTWARSLPAAAAIVAKGYAALPALATGGWRALLVAGALLLVTAPVLPWEAFIAQYPSIAATLADQAWGGRDSILTSPPVVVAGVIALLLLGLPRAGWLAVPVVWPSTQLHYSTIALPATSSWLAMFGAVPEPGVFGLGVILLAVAERRRDRAGRGEGRPSGVQPPAEA